MNLWLFQLLSNPQDFILEESCDQARDVEEIAILIPQVCSLSLSLSLIG